MQGETQTNPQELPKKPNWADRILESMITIALSITIAAVVAGAVTR